MTYSQISQVLGLGVFAGGGYSKPVIGIIEFLNVFAACLLNHHFGNGGFNQHL
jgi:hypothetical protein